MRVPEMEPPLKLIIWLPGQLKVVVVQNVSVPELPLGIAVGLIFCLADVVCPWPLAWQVTPEGV